MSKEATAEPTSTRVTGKEPVWRPILLTMLTLGCPSSLLAEVGPPHGQIERDRNDIRGGRPATLDKIRFSTVVSTYRQYCSGTLIAPTWVLTGAHCLAGENDPLELIEMGYRSSAAPESRDISEQNSDIKRVIIHPEFSSNQGYSPFVNDVALIELERPFTNPLFKPIHLVLNREQEARYAPSETTATQASYGGSRNFDPLQELESTMYLGTDCHDAFDLSQSEWGMERTKAMLHQKTICTGFPPRGNTDRGAEVGDSGGAVVVTVGTSADGEPEWGLVGVHSHSITNKAGRRFVSVATRVSSIYDWVKSHVDLTPVSETQILTHVFAGPLANATAHTEITLANRTTEPCMASVLFHRGTEEAPPVRFNGEYMEDNRMEVSLEGGGFNSEIGAYYVGQVQQIVLTADPGRDLAVGAVYVTQAPECLPGALNVEGRYVITDNEGQVAEAFSIQPQSESDWLTHASHVLDPGCRTVVGRFGSQDDIGLAMVTVQPGQDAPPGTELDFTVYEWDGPRLLGAHEGDMEITGEQHALNPWGFSGPRTIRICLWIPDDQPKDFRLSLIAIGARTSSRSVQYYTSDLIRP